MKKLIFVLVALLCYKTGISQTFYETSWNGSDGTTYTGLLIYYDDNDALMRIKYNKNGSYKVAEYRCKGKYFDKNGLEGYLLDGQNAKIVYGDKNNSTYYSDNFIFVKRGDTYGNPVLIDEVGLTSSNPKSKTHDVTYWKTIPTSTFTTDYVHNFFEKDEDLYNELLAYNSAEPTTTTTTTTTTAGLQEGTIPYGEYVLTNISTGPEKWAFIMSEGSGFTSQKWQKTDDFPKDFIREQWDDGYYITDLGHKDGNWVAVMSKGSGYTHQYWKKSNTFPKDWISEKWDEDHSITSVSFGHGEWALVMSKGTGYGYQSWKTSEEFPQEWIKEHWDDSYYITSVSYGNNLWAVVMTKDCGIYQQSWKTNYEYPKDWIREKWDDTYYINAIAKSSDLWAAVMSKGTGYTRQSWNSGKNFPKDWINEKSGGYSNTTTTTPTTTTPTTTTPVVNTGNAKIHLITVSNTMSNIGPSCQVDENNMVREFENISEALNIPLNKVVLNNKDVSRTALSNALRNLNPGSNDIVVFAYSGHGYRWSNQTSKYPNLDLRYSDYMEISNTNNYNLEDVYNEITAKGARLNIVIGDCCNSDIGVTSRGGNPSLASRSFTQGQVEKLAELFIQKRGNIIAAAARPYETSCGSNADGGYFISSFIASLHKETSSIADDEPQWSQVFDLAIESANYKTQNLNGCDTQNGMYASTVN